MIDERYSLTPGSSERELLTTFLEFQRNALVRKCAGLSDEQMCRRAIPTSNISLVGLVRHLATVERWYFQSVIAGGSPGELYDYESDEAFNDVDGASGEESLRIWADEVTASRRSRPPTTSTPSARSRPKDWLSRCDGCSCT